ncbi:hypothetical protein M0802_009424 [Mischocyttarus mexicanus]|nr:hypothetical protein M0802_009424 [Mischocyttarus mexicanus]
MFQQQIEHYDGSLYKVVLDSIRNPMDTKSKFDVPLINSLLAKPDSSYELRSSFTKLHSINIS